MSSVEAGVGHDVDLLTSSEVRDTRTWTANEFVAWALGRTA